MRDLALQIARVAIGKERNVLREYLQNYILLLMQKLKMSESLYFMGGTALRFLYGIRRYSEDLDFSAGDGWVGADLKSFSDKINRELKQAGYDVMISFKDLATVQRMMIRFPGLLYELGLSPRREQKISIHVEIDNNPPAGWNEERTIVNIHHPIMIRHYDLPSAFAGKLSAVLLRPYTKGRDVFDIFWFRSRWRDLIPNLALLNNAVRQKNPNAVAVTEAKWCEVVHDKLTALDWDAVKIDVLPFLETEDDLTAFSREGLLSLY